MSFFFITTDPPLHRSDRSSVPGMDIANPFIKVVHVGMLMRWDVFFPTKSNPHLHFRFGSGQSGPQRDAFSILLKAVYTFCILALSSKLLHYLNLLSLTFGVGRRSGILI